MKKIITILLLLLTITLAGCEPTNTGNTGDTNPPADTDDPVIPVLVLEGPASITLVEGDTFTDPGAKISNLADLDTVPQIDVEGSVDTNTPGTYQLVYKIFYDGEDYEVSRTVIIEEQQPIVLGSVKLTNINVLGTNNDIVADFVIDVTNATIQSFSVDLIQNGTSLETRTVNGSGPKSIIFDNLDYASEYTVEVNYSYNDGEKLVEVTETLGTSQTEPELYGYPTIELDNCVIETDYVNCYYNLGANNLSYSPTYTFQLYKNNEYLDQIVTTDGSYTGFTGLDSNTEYEIRILADYSNGGSQTTTGFELTRHWFTTLEAIDPVEISSYSYTATGTSATFSYVLSDPNYTFQNGSIEIVDSTTNQVIETHMLFRGENSITVNNITPLRGYNVNFYATYYDSANNLVSNKLIAERSFSTDPDITLDSFTTHSAPYSDVDTILEINLTNPDDIVVTAVVIDSIEYTTFEAGSTNQKILINIGQLNTGSHTVKLNNLTVSELYPYTFVYNQDVTFNVSDRPTNVPDDAEITVAKVDTLSPLLELPAGTTSQSAVFYVHLNNPHNMQVIGLSIGSTHLEQSDITVINPNLVTFNWDITYAQQNVRVSQVEYMKNGTATMQNQYYSNYIITRGYHDHEVVEIYTKSQFITMGIGNNVYKIMNDIDCEGEYSEWATSIHAFEGIIIGNGYTVSNITISRDITGSGDSEFIGGVFGKGQGAYVEGLTLDNVSINFTMTYHKLSKVGTLFGQCSDCVIDDVHITNSSISSTLSKSGTVGGIIGYASYTSITDSSSDVAISLNVGGTSAYSTTAGMFVGQANNSRIDRNSSFGFILLSDAASPNGGIVGGIVGKLDSNSYISNTISNTNVSNSGGMSGGIVGHLYGGSSAYVVNVIVTGTITGNRDYVGGIAGHAGSGNIFDTITLGDVKTSNIYAGRVYGGKGTIYLPVIDNCLYIETMHISSINYATVSIVDVDDTNVTSITEIESLTATFYQDNNFNPEVWDLTNLDATNKPHPTIK